MSPARIRSLISQLMAVTLLSLSSLSTEAAQLCHEVFSEENTPAAIIKSFIPTEASDIYPGMSKDLAQLQVLMHLNNHVPAAGQNKAALTDLRSEIESKISKSLKKRGIKVEETLMSSNEVSLYGLEWYHFKIKPEGSHWLNRMAARLKKKLDVDLVYDPIFNTLGDFKASFTPETKTIYLSVDTVTKKNITDLDGHEIIHAHLWGQQHGKTSFLPKAPVHIVMESARDIDPSAMGSGYQRLMSFEEMVTFPYNISVTAKHIQQKKIETSSTLKYRIQTLLQISKNVEISVFISTHLMNSKNAFPMETATGKYYVLSSPSGDYSLKITIPNNLVGTPERFISAEMQRAARLAEFNKNYFINYEHWSETELLEKSIAFRDLQKIFINEL